MCDTKLQILSSKGDMGIFRTDKREVTKPMVFFCAHIKWLKIRIYFCECLIGFFFIILILLAPQEFNFPTDKRLQNPPIELFSKVDGQMVNVYLHVR